MNIIAIDPGTNESAYVGWINGRIDYAQIKSNSDVLHMLRSIYPPEPFLIACEMVACYGMSVGKEVFETVLIIGRIQEICASRGFKFQLVYRRDVKLHHCQSVRAKDGNVRQALIDKYGEPGTKKTPGKTYGLKSHLWQAFAIATFLTESK